VAGQVDDRYLMKILMIFLGDMAMQWVEALSMDPSFYLLQLLQPS